MKWTDAIVKIIAAFDPKANPVYALTALAMIAATIIALVALVGTGGTGLAVAAGVGGTKLVSMLPRR